MGQRDPHSQDLGAHRISALRLKTERLERIAWLKEIKDITTIIGNIVVIIGNIAVTAGIVLVGLRR